ncbi:MAG: low molecular weight phosphatase family protein [Candidatus Binatia bacterium]
MESQILFLCTGNYYRSRFAELLFNHAAVALGLQWRAASRGIAITEKNIGPISPYAIQRLREHWIPIPGNVSYPVQAQEYDLEQADRIIALYELEHRPLLQQRFPDWEERVGFWHVPDVHLVTATTALATIEGNVQRLIEELSAIDLEA